MAINRTHPRWGASVRFVLYDPQGIEAWVFGSATDCANAVVVHLHPERLMVRGVDANGERVFAEPAEDFGMTVYD